MCSNDKKLYFDIKELKHDNVNDLLVLHKLYELNNEKRLNFNSELDIVLITFAKRNSKYLSVIPWYVSKNLDNVEKLKIIVDENSLLANKNVVLKINSYQSENDTIEKLYKFYEADFIDINSIHPAYIPALKLNNNIIQKILLNDRLVKILFIIFLGIEQRPLYHSRNFFDFFSILMAKVNDSLSLDNYIVYILNEIKLNLSKIGKNSLTLSVNEQLVYTYVKIKLQAINNIDYKTDIINTDLDIYLYLFDIENVVNNNIYDSAYKIIYLLKNPHYNIVSSIKPYELQLTNINGDAFESTDLENNCIYQLKEPKDIDIDDIKYMLKDTIPNYLKFEILNGFSIQ